jgi:serine protease inhibitor
VSKASLRICATLLCAVLLLTACGTPKPRGDAARIDAKLVADLRPGDARTVGQAVDEFGFDLFAKVADARQNTIVSPLSMTVLLAMLLAGSDGPTATEIANVLHLSDKRDVRVGALLRQLSDTDQVTLSVADSLWAGADAPINQDYKTFLEKTFGATVQNGDLGSPGTAKDIDKWASRNTDGLIDNIASDLGLPDPSVLLVLLNAVYFLGKWQIPFDQGSTRPEQFGDIGDVPMMHLNDETFGYTQRKDYRMLRLPYGKDGRYGMEIMLPDDGHTLAGLLGSLDAAEWRTAVDSLQQKRIDEVALPRFELRWTATLNDALSKLGMPAAFAPGSADFRPMSPANPALTKIVQKTYVKVDEHGTQAAAVSGGAVATSAQIGSLDFRVDRPFAFSIDDQQTGAILFLGAVADPHG